MQVQAIMHTIFLPTMQQPPPGQGFLFIEASRLHSVGILWKGDQPGVEASTCTTHDRQTSIAAVGFEPESERPPTHALDRAGHRNGRSTLLSQPVYTGLISPALTEGDVPSRHPPYFLVNCSPDYRLLTYDI